jgi:hypothetical protein
VAPKAAKPAINRIFSKDHPPDDLVGGLVVGATLISDGSIDGVGVDSGTGCCGSSWDGITAGGIVTCGSGIGCKETYSGLAGSVGNL